MIFKVALMIWSIIGIVGLPPDLIK